MSKSNVHQSPPLAIDKLFNLFEVDSDNGILIRKVGPRYKKKPAGYVDSKGRLRVQIEGHTYGVHRIIFAMYHRRWPVLQIDHINRDKLDNRPCNLREVTNAENCKNRARTKPTKTGVKGVILHKGRFIARIMKDYKPISLGSFDSLLEAKEAYLRAAKELHGEYACLENEVS